jgi:hypothetical protein
VFVGAWKEMTFTDLCRGNFKRNAGEAFVAGSEREAEVSFGQVDEAEKDLDPTISNSAKTMQELLHTKPS